MERERDEKGSREARGCQLRQGSCHFAEKQRVEQRVECHLARQVEQEEAEQRAEK